MSDLSYKGILVAVEGIDGAGKTTQVKLLLEAFRRAGEAVTASKEPTNGEWGSILRQSALTGRLSLEDELETFIKDRTEHVTNLILPALQAGETVILDRYFYSTIAYQGARGASVTSVTDRMFMLFPKPDITFILDIDPVLGIHRIANDRAEEPNHFEDRANLASAREIFSAIAGAEIERLDGALPVQFLHRQILETIVEGPFKKKRCAKSYGCDDPFHCMFALTKNCEWLKARSQLLAAAK